jgi:integrase
LPNAITGPWLSSGSGTSPALKSAFLQYTEQERGDSIGTRNCRLAALRSFFGFVAGREPATAEQCAEVLRIPTKKARTLRPIWIRRRWKPFWHNPIVQPSKVNAIRRCCPSCTTRAPASGKRWIYANAVRWESPACVRLYGKGRKERLCPLWPETVSLLKALLKRQPRRDDERLFVNRYGPPLGASGARFKLTHYIAAAAKKVPNLASKNVTPHSFRHATAIHLVAVDITVIRSWLGHVSLDTTNHYAQANLETKRKALERVEPRSKPDKLPRWRRDHSILEWLDSL